MTKSLFPALRSNFPALRGSFLGNWDDLWEDFDKLWIDSWFSSNLTRRAFSTSEVSDTAYTLRMELPGVQGSEVNVEREGTVLKIRAEQDQKENKSYFSFEKSMTLPEDADVEKITADLKDGVLTVSIPRKPQVEEKSEPSVKIEVKS